MSKHSPWLRRKYLWWLFTCRRWSSSIWNLTCVWQRPRASLRKGKKKTDLLCRSLLMNTLTKQLCSLVIVHQYPALVSENKSLLVRLTGDNPALHTQQVWQPDLKLKLKLPGEANSCTSTKLSTEYNNVFIKSIKDRFKLYLVYLPCIILPAAMGCKQMSS